MQEKDRPLSERVTVLDRAPSDADRLATAPLASLLRLGDSLDQVRVAFEQDSREVLVGRDEGDGLYLALLNAGGDGGACGSARWVLRERGAIVMMGSDGQRAVVAGIVADDVTAVRVDDVPVYLRDNAFLAAVGRDDTPVLTITTSAGDREWRLPEPPPEP